MSETLEIAITAIRMFAEQHPRPAHVNQQQAAEMLNVSRHTVSRMLKAGTLRYNKVGMIPISEIDRALAAK